MSVMSVTGPGESRRQTSSRSSSGISREHICQGRNPFDRLMKYCLTLSFWALLLSCWAERSISAVPLRVNSARNLSYWFQTTARCFAESTLSAEWKGFFAPLRMTTSEEPALPSTSLRDS